MRLLVSCIALVSCTVWVHAAPRFSFHVLGDDPGSWPAVLSSIGLVQGANAPAGVVVAPSGTDAPFEEWALRVERGTLLVLEGESPLAAAFGFTASGKPKVRVQSVEDLQTPELRVIWEKPLDLPLFDIPGGARVFARDRWQHAPLMAGYRRGGGGVLWVAAPPGPNGGYDRFPHIPQALMNLGLEAPFDSRRLWAFFDSSYRLRADPDYLAERWRAGGIAALHVAAWHFWERDAQNDEYLRRLLDACHRHAILVYAWVEFPHVSEKSWNDHPQWREQTALLQDAQLDWRKLMNLSHPDAFAAVHEGLRDLLTGFDWDGVNLAELYFESLEGHDNPARFTPMNQDVRLEFQSASKFDPLDLFDAQSPRHWSKNTQGLAAFLDYRADLARRQQEQWIGRIEEIRRSKPHLDLTLTHIDDRFDTSMREKLGADTSRVLPLMKQHDFTLLIEDPATIWNLGPRRYPQIAARYAPLTAAREKLAIDINIVERYQDVYPTKQQTGIELFQLVHMAAGAFARVALYFENSIPKADWKLLASSAATVEQIQQSGDTVVVESRRGVGLPWKGPALVDGKVWPVAGDTVVWLPAGSHVIEPSYQSSPLIRVLDFNGDVRSAKATSNGVEVAYHSNARALAVLDHVPARVEIDGEEVSPDLRGNVLVLPRGQHFVTLTPGK